MRSQIFSLAATALTFSSFAWGQTSTDCDPLTNTTCPSDPALGKTVTIDFTQGESSEFTADSGTTITYGDNGAEFIITSDGDAKTIVSDKYIFFGKVEVAMRAANGTGIVSSFVMESDDLDEIDLEWLGGNATVVETNYFGKGNTTTYNRATYPKVDDPQETWHIYTIDWTSEYVKWYVDGSLVRTLLYADALDGKNFPQTPMRLKIGNWVGGAADEATGTVEWAGGYTDLDDAPFTMYVKNLTIEDYTTSGNTYTYGNETGSYTSIIISNSTSSNSTTSSSTSTGGTSYTANSTVGTSSSDNSTTSTSSASSEKTSSTSSSTSGASMVGYDIGLLAVLGLGLAYFL
ncbi:concanavalin A-like lectin/glucanase [Mollisia scopiformis]|uniref:chitinase n=1 Tax=Mollisia scopiformis TaxID=149040 RepID=A0A194XEE7_MOLSC|nr:concanavalin A-like lectin/glucanase [Mollisia scopiformis]KUJ18132.1 concanavalin A-like lectin/glucanase [Mollisia scopiformis]